jgi:ABC-type antimicrobial peptide transport system permease subunit
VQVVGVAADVKYEGVREAATEMIYLPSLQGRGPQGVALYTIALRAARDAIETAAAFQRELRRQAPDLLISNLVTLEERRDAMLARERIIATLSIWFAALALLLGCVGLYGTLAYAVARRTSELAVRIALGAGWARLLRLVLSESLRPVTVGVLIGLPLAFVTGRLSERLLFGIRGSDPTSYGLAILVLLCAAGCAAAVPARRATLVDPIAALRSE